MEHNRLVSNEHIGLLEAVPYDPGALVQVLDSASLVSCDSEGHGTRVRARVEGHEEDQTEHQGGGEMGGHSEHL